MHPILQMFRDVVQGKAPIGARRSGSWPRVRKEHLCKFPACAVCGEKKKKVEVHHIKPFHLHPSLELDPANLITLCESMDNGMSCHQMIGHLGNFKSINDEVLVDAPHWARKISTRP